MVLEQVLTIIFAVGVGAALIVYAARPRHRGASISMGATSVGSFAPAEMSRTAPMPQIATVETSVVETSHVEQTTAEIAPVVTDAAATGTLEVAPAATEMASHAIAPPAPIGETVEAPAHKAASTPRAQRKRSTSTKSRARSTRKSKT